MKGSLSNLAIAHVHITHDFSRRVSFKLVTVHIDGLSRVHAGEIRA